MMQWKAAVLLVLTLFLLCIYFTGTLNNTCSPKIKIVRELNEVSPNALTPNEVKSPKKASDIHDHGFWIAKDITGYQVYDPSLAKALIRFLKRENASTVIDLGAGTGMYAKEMMSENMFVSCYDGNPNTIEITEGRCASVDLSKPINFVKYDWVISLEVGEHIPQIYEDIFLNNLHKVNKKGMILSWGVEGQGGHGHVNLHNNDYLKNKITKMGYTVDEDYERLFRRASTLWWFKNTIMVFRKNAISIFRPVFVRKRPKISVRF